MDNSSSKYREYRDLSVNHKICRKFVEKLKDYFKGIPISINQEEIYFQRANSFYRTVYINTLKIAYGEVSTYKFLARKAGKPMAYRAVATALRKNPFLIFVPCHRVIRSDGRIGGKDSSSFLVRKYLLKKERSLNNGKT